MQQKKLSDGLMMTVSVLAVASFCGLSAVKAQEGIEDLGTIVVKTVEGEADIDSDAVLDSEVLGSLNAQDMQDIFASTPAVSAAGGSAVSQKLYMHGIDQSKVNVAIDGARQRSGVWHHTTGDIAVDPEMLRQVDVKSGLSPADAGPGALAGTIAFETKDARDLLKDGQSMGGRLSAGFRSNGSVYNVSGAAYGMKDGFEILGYLKRAGGNNYEEGGGLAELGTDVNAWSGLAKLAYEAEEGHRFSLSGEYLYDTGYRQLRANMNYDPMGTVLFNDHTQKRTTLTARYTTTKPSDMFDPDVQLYLNRFEIERPFGNYPRYNGDFNSDMMEIGGKALNTFTFGNAQITAGFDFYNNRIDLDRFYSNDRVSEDITNLGALVQLRFKPIERLDLSAGLRLDHQIYKSVDNQTISNTGLSPNIMAELELIDGIKAKLGASSVFGGLEPSEMALYGSSLRYGYAANIDPVRSNNFEAGLSFTHGGFSAEFTAFHTRMMNVLAYDFSGWPVSASRVSGPALVSNGIDLSARYDWDNAFLAASFSHVDVEYNGGVAAVVNNTSATVGDQLTLQGAYNFQNYDLTIGALANIAFELDEAVGNPADRKAYQAVDIFAQYKPDNLEGFSLRAEVSNLFDQKYVARGNYLGGSSRGTPFEPIHATGRSFNIKATRTF